MKRGLVLSLCALAVAASATIAQAQTIDLSLNLRYTNPANPAAGGIWYLTGKTSGGATNMGIASVSAWLENVSTTVFHGSGVATGNGYPAVTQATIKNVGDADNANNPFAGTFGSAVNVLYGQDTTTVAGIQGGIGQGSGASNVATDPLRNTAFNNYSVLLSGTFAGGGNAGNQFNRPRFAPLETGTITGGSVLASTTVANTPSIAATIGAANLKVRGDSLFSFGLNTPPTAGLRPGDANRDGAVGPADFALIGTNWNPSATNKGWDTADFNSDGAVGPADFALLGTGWNPGGSNFVPPALSAIPEPSTLTSVLAACAAGVIARRRRKV